MPAPNPRSYTGYRPSVVTLFLPFRETLGVRLGAGGIFPGWRPWAGKSSEAQTSLGLPQKRLQPRHLAPGATQRHLTSCLYLSGDTGRGCLRFHPVPPVRFLGLTMMYSSPSPYPGLWVDGGSSLLGAAGGAPGP